MNKLFDKTFILFILVGIVNTLVSLVLMFVLSPLGYWKSTAIAYIAGGLVSFFLNRYVTFKNNGNFFKFALNVFLCYITAYLAAYPLKSFSEVLSKLFGMGLYTIINYLGQKFFAFKSDTKK